MLPENDAPMTMQGGTQQADQLSAAQSNVNELF